MATTKDKSKTQRRPAATQVRDKQEDVVETVEEAEKDITKMRAEEEAKLEHMEQTADKLYDIDKELESEMRRERFENFGARMWERTKDAAYFAGRAAVGPIPKTKREIGLAFVWYGLGAVTPMGEPARAVVRAVR